MKIYDYQGRRNVCGKQICRLRKGKHISRNELTSRLKGKGLTLKRDSIRRIEDGTRFVADYELYFFAEILGVTVADLLEIQEQP